MKFTGTIEPTPPVKTIGENGHWEFEEPMGVGIGFVYVVFDTILKRAYIGKKTYLGSGVRNKDKESNWKSYVTSSNLLKDMFKERPLDEFEFICLEQYHTKGTLSYAETWSLCYVEAPTSKKWYNCLVEKVCWPVKEPITQRHKDRLNHVMRRME